MQKVEGKSTATRDLSRQRDRLKMLMPGIDQHFLITDLEVSALTGIPRGSLGRMRCAGTGFPYTKIDGTVRYYLNDVLEHVRAHTRHPVRASMEGMRNAAQKKG